MGVKLKLDDIPGLFTVFLLLDDSHNLQKKIKNHSEQLCKVSQKTPQKTVLKHTHAKKAFCCVNIASIILRCKH